MAVGHQRTRACAHPDREGEGEIEQAPEAEQKDLALIFQAKGLSRADAQRVAAALMRDKQATLDTLAREELGIDPAEMGGNPWSAASFSFALFAVGAIFPVVPFLLTTGTAAIVFCIGLSTLALGAIGVVTSLFNGRGLGFSAARQMLFACAAAGVTGDASGNEPTCLSGKVVQECVSRLTGQPLQELFHTQPAAGRTHQTWDKCKFA